MHPTTIFDLVRREHEQRLADARLTRERRSLLVRRDPGTGAPGRPPEQRRGWALFAAPALAVAVR